MASPNNLKSAVLDLYSRINTYKGTGRPDKPETTGGVIKGSESDGITYISTDGAGVGAWQWVKAGGKWQVSVGDTGWIKVESPELAKGAIYLRRTEAGCYITVRGGDWDSFQLKTMRTGKYNLYNVALPTGFTSPTAVAQPLTYDYVSTHGYLLLTSKSDASRIQLKVDNTPANNRYLRANMLYYISDDVWVDKLTL